MQHHLRVVSTGLVMAMLGVFSLAVAGHGQIVVGEVIERGSGEPLRGVFVALLDQAGERVAGVLSDERGRYTLRAPAAGRYALRADRIGYESVYSPPLDVTAVVSHRFELASRAVELAGLVVEAETRECRLRPDEGTRLQEIWDQVRMAAEIAVWTEETGFLRFDGLQYERILDPVTLGVTDERVRPGRTIDGRPFGVRSAEELVTDGFIQLEHDHYVFFGLDAATILSDAFLDTHCFRITADPDGEDLVGLQFEPARERSVPDVAGVLWIDEKTAELRTLEYRYTQVPWGLPREPFGGAVEFRRLPSGAWIVQRWSIRMPRLERVPGDLAMLVRRRPEEVLRRLMEEAGLSIKEDAGELVAIYTEGGIRLPMPERAALQGIVYDSIAGRPLDGARVQLAGTEYEARTDELGRFRLDDLPGGTYTLTFDHAVLDSLGLALPASEVILARGDLTETELAVPAAATAYAMACAPGGDGAAKPIVGRVLDSRTGLPVVGASVELSVAAAPGGDGAGREIRAATDGQGVYRLCDVPAPGDVVIRADFHGHGRAEVTRVASAAEPVFHEFSLELDLPTRLAGRVLDAESGRPIRGVAVNLDGPAEVAVQVTGSTGRFLFPDIPLGEYVLRAEHIGYLPVAESVRLVGSGRTIDLEVRLGTQAIPLNPVVVTVAARPTTGLLGRVYDRIERVRHSGGGTVFDRHDIERRSPARLTHLVSQARGVRLERLISPGEVANRPGYVLVSSRAHMPRHTTMVDDDGEPYEIFGYEACPMAVYLDGMLIQPGGLNFDPVDGDIDALASVSDVEAVEVYHPADRMPPEVSPQQAACGAVLVWTRRGTG